MSGLGKVQQRRGVETTPGAGWNATSLRVRETCVSVMTMRRAARHLVARPRAAPSRGVVVVAVPTRNLLVLRVHSVSVAYGGAERAPADCRDAAACSFVLLLACLLAAAAAAASCCCRSPPQPAAALPPSLASPPPPPPPHAAPPPPPAQKARASSAPCSPLPAAFLLPLLAAVLLTRRRRAETASSSPARASKT